MNLIGQLTSGDWAKKSAKSAKLKIGLANLAGNSHKNYLSEFNSLFEELRQPMQWNNLDLDAWKEDLKNNPKTVISCLRAIKKSIQQGRRGIINEMDWIDI